MPDMPTIKVELVSNGSLIGTATLSAVDPSMGVAAGPFEPAPAYDMTRHADEIPDMAIREGLEPVELRALSGERIETRSVAIADYFGELGERQATAFFVSAEQYEGLFPGAYELERKHYESLDADSAPSSGRNLPTRIIEHIARLFRR